MRKGTARGIIRAVIGKSCMNCGGERMNERSSYCEPCFEGLLKAKLREDKPYETTPN